MSRLPTVSRLLPLPFWCSEGQFRSNRKGAVPQAYVRARASSATLRSVHVSRVFLCISRLKTRFGKRGLLEKGSFQKSPFSRDSGELEILEILENTQTVEN